MSTFRSRRRDRRHASHQARALHRAMRSVNSKAVRNEMLSLLGH